MRITSPSPLQGSEESYSQPWKVMNMPAIEVFQLEGGVRDSLTLSSLSDLFSYGIYPGGEPYVKFAVDARTFPRSAKILVVGRLSDFVDLGYFHQTVEAIKACGVKDVYGFIPYFPGGRGDRTTYDPVMPVTLSLTTAIINSLGLKTVWVLDEHSSHTVSRLESGIALPSNLAIQQAVAPNSATPDEYGYGYDIPKTDHDYVAVIAPDAGAERRAQSVARSLGLFGAVIQCDKTRDEATGKISDFSYGKLFKGQGRYLMVDDICDGGGTFAGLLSKIREVHPAKDYPIDLWVTHGIFSGNAKRNLSGFDRILYTDSLGPNPDIGTQVGIDTYYPAIMNGMNK